MSRKPKNTKNASAEPDDQISLDGVKTPESPTEIPFEQIEILDKIDDNDIVSLIRDFNDEDSASDNITTAYPAKILYKTGDGLSHIVFDEKDNLINQGVKNILTRQRYARNDSITKFSIIVDNEHLVIGNRRLTPIEKAVMDSVITFYIFKEKYIPLNSIVRKVLFKNSTFHPTVAQIQLIRDCLNMLSSARIAIDYTEDIKKKADKKGVKVSRFKKDSALLNYSLYEGTVNGHSAQVVEILDTPILLEYARLEGQVVIVKEEAITTPINKTIDAIIIQEYLIQQIVYYHGNKSENAIIYYENIFSFLPERELLSATSERTFKAKIYRVIHTILDYWATIELIRGYEIKNKARIKYHHIVIYLNQQTPLIEKS